MENKSNIIKITAIGAISLAALYLIYKFTSGKSTATPIKGKKRISNDEFSEVVDQKLPREEKQKEAHEFVVQYILKHINGRSLQVTADGKFKPDDFKVLLRIMNFYAQSIIYDIKIRNQLERIGYLEVDLSQYVDTMKSQQTSEVDAYNESLTFICETAKINQETFMKTYGNETVDKESFKNELINQCMSPFVSQRAFTKEQTIEMFVNVASMTIDKLKEIQEMFEDIEQYDLVIYFDKLITDFAKLHHGVDCIEFWASICKYDLLSEPREP